MGSADSEGTGRDPAQDRARRDPNSPTKCIQPETQEVTPLDSHRDCEALILCFGLRQRVVPGISDVTADLIVAEIGVDYPVLPAVRLLTFGRVVTCVRKSGILESI